MRAAVLLLAALLVSCAEHKTPAQTYESNQAALDHPEIVGTLPDGRTLYHSVVKVQGSDWPQHIYFAGNDMTVNAYQGKVNAARAIIAPELKKGSQ